MLPLSSSWGNLGLIAKISISVSINWSKISINECNSHSVSTSGQRTFPNLINQDNEEYLPLFDNLDSLAKWHNEAYFSQAFKENNGQVLLLKIDELLNGEDEAINDLGKSLGITVNPLDYSQEEVQNSMVTWEELTRD